MSLIIIESRDIIFINLRARIIHEQITRTVYDLDREHIHITQIEWQESKLNHGLIWPANYQHYCRPEPLPKPTFLGFLLLTVFLLLPYLHSHQMEIQFEIGICLTQYRIDIVQLMLILKLDFVCWAK